MRHSRTRDGRALYAGKDTRTPPNACLDCGKVLDAALGVGHRKKPKPGSITICMDCGHIQAFDGQLRFRPLTDKEIHDIAGDEIVLISQAARGEYAKRKANGKDQADAKGNKDQAPNRSGSQGLEDAQADGGGAQASEGKV